MKYLLVIWLIWVLLGVARGINKNHQEEMKKLDSIYTQLQQLELVDQ